MHGAALVVIIILFLCQVLRTVKPLQIAGIKSATNCFVLANCLHALACSAHAVI